MSPLSKRKRKLIESDKNQVLLAPQKTSGTQTKEESRLLVRDYAVVKCMCPFCLHTDYAHRFYIKIKKGYSEKRAKCPDCNTLMQMKSLTAHMSAEEYAEWVYNYSASGFWKKVNFKQFNERMRALGFSYEFWAKYKELKAGRTKETPEDAYERYIGDYDNDT